MKIVIDATPIMINRTAVYHLAWDIVYYFSNRYAASVLIYDRIYHYNEVINLKNNIDDYFIARCQEGINNFIESASKNKSYYIRNHIDLNGSCVIYLDPLYCLLDYSIDNSIVLIHDLTPLTHPTWHTPLVCGAYLSAYKKIQSSQISIIADSQSTARDLWVNFGIPRDNIEIAYLYNRKIDKFREIYSTTEIKNQFLFVGSLEERKNVSTLIKAFSLSNLNKIGFHLKIVGGDGYGSYQIRKDAKNIQGVDVLGFVSEKELNKLYNNSLAFVYPSMWEGFGLPLIEAMRRGLICIASSHSAMGEVGKDAVIFIDPEKPESIAGALVDVANMDLSTRNEFRKRSFIRSKFFSFSKFISVFEKTLEKKKNYTTTSFGSEHILSNISPEEERAIEAEKRVLDMEAKLLEIGSNLRREAKRAIEAEKQVLEAEKKLIDILNSRSWKITKPLRVFFKSSKVIQKISLKKINLIFKNIYLKILIKFINLLKNNSFLKLFIIKLLKKFGLEKKIIQYYYSRFYVLSNNLEENRDSSNEIDSKLSELSPYALEIYEKLLKIIQN